MVFIQVDVYLIEKIIYTKVYRNNYKTADTFTLVLLQSRRFLMEAEILQSVMCAAD